MSVVIRPAVEEDFDAIWPIFESVARAGDTYAYSRNITHEEAYQQWMVVPRKTFVCELDGNIAATYYLKTNAYGPGSHVCNAGFMTAEAFRGRGLAAAMCEHAQREAIKMQYLAMQFNFVASTNTGAVALWERQGFDIVGRLPKAFKHPSHGLVDALVMYKWLIN